LQPANIHQLILNQQVNGSEVTSEKTQFLFCTVIANRRKQFILNSQSPHPQKSRLENLRRCARRVLLTYFCNHFYIAGFYGLKGAGKIRNIVSFAFGSKRAGVGNGFYFPEGNVIG
jgi:hypothetical protein